LTDRKGVFRFELNESLYFESGQEVEEIIGVSLEPEISIQTFHEYVSIRGVIELSGDYYKLQLSTTLDDEPPGMNDYHEKNFIEQVIDKTDTQAVFTHRFPVEISIPSYRVNDLDDVTVQVSTFDYEIPNHHQMKITAAIEIEGINDGIPAENDEPSFIPEKEEQGAIEQNEARTDEHEEAPHHDSYHDILDETSNRVETIPEIKYQDHESEKAPPTYTNKESNESTHNQEKEAHTRMEESVLNSAQSQTELEMANPVEKTKTAQNVNSEMKIEHPTDQTEGIKEDDVKAEVPDHDDMESKQDGEVKAEVPDHDDMESKLEDDVKVEVSDQENAESKQEDDVKVEMNNQEDAEFKQNEEKEDMKTEKDEHEEQGTIDSERKKHRKPKKSLLLSDFFKDRDEKNTERSLTMEEAAENENTKDLDLEELDEEIKTNEHGKESEENEIPIDSISEMFEQDREDKYAKMRLCIVQDSDTIDRIAERYDITTNQIMLKNRLDDDTVMKGQLLFIPEKVNK